MACWAPTPDEKTYRWNHRTERFELRDEFDTLIDSLTESQFQEKARRYHKERLNALYDRDRPSRQWQERAARENGR